jgi:stearoyl-CoA desaturase (delta-9 desaturase)
MLKKIRRLPLPEGVALRKIDWVAVLTIGSFHLLAMLAFLPWLFNWSSVWVMVVGVFVFGYLGINLCYHRLLTHKGLVCPKWLEHVFAVLAVCCMQDTPARWVGIHRWHHVKSDESDDPHTPLAGLAWGHVGWVFLKNDQIDRYTIYTRFAKDILRDPFYKRLETTARYPLIIVASWGLFFSVGFAIELLWGGSFVQAIQFGLSLLIWGVFVRTVVVWHVTWSVNSLAHVFGYRNYDTSDDSRNNWFVALMTLGEGWHNNHHADARSSRHGHRWFEIDLTFSVIQLLEYVGLATNVIRPSKRLNDDKKLNVVG